MVAVQIRHVPDEVRDALTAEADRRGESLQTYLHDVLVREASAANNRALVRRWMSEPAAARLTVDVSELIAQQRHDRERRVTDAAFHDHAP